MVTEKSKKRESFFLRRKAWRFKKSAETVCNHSQIEQSCEPFVANNRKTPVQYYERDYNNNVHYCLLHSRSF